MVKKILIFILINILIISFSYAKALTSITYDNAIHDYDVRDITLMLNNDKFEPSQGQMPPIILNDRTLVPVREVFEYLGGKVDWDGNERKVSVSFDDKTITLWIDKADALINDKQEVLDVPAKIINDKTMVPVRFISEKAGLQVSWDAETYTVDIKYQRANITNIRFATINGINCMIAFADSKITGYKYFSLVKGESEYYRLVLDIENCNFVFDTTNASFEEGMVASIRFGNQGNGTNRIVIDLRDETDYVVTMSKDRKALYFAMAQEFIVPGEEPEQQVTPAPVLEATPTPAFIPTPVLEITPTPTFIPTPQEEIKLPSENESGEIKENTSNEVNSREEKSGEEPEIIDEKDLKSGENIKIDGNESLDDIDISEFTKHDYEDSFEEEPDYEVTIESIKYSTVSERIKIKYTGKISYDDMTLTNPNRVVIDIPDAKLDVSGPTEITIKNSIITGVRFSQYTKSSVRIVIDLSAKGDYSIYKRTSELQISVVESTYKNIKYKKNTSNSQITLQDVSLDDLKYYQNEKNYKYFIEYKEDKYDFGSGTMAPDDDNIKNISVDDGKITILDTGHKSYAIRQSGKNIIITVREKKEEEPYELLESTISSESGENSGDDITKTVNDKKKIIMIDVGHGGSDPGACNGDEQEKVYNLKIAQYLYDLLKEREDIEVYMDRKSNDTYLNREDRVAYATNLNPDFIVSIHNNSLENKSYSGTMVLYYNNDTESDFGDVTSKECADIIVSELISKLGTINRGVVNRGDLHILSKTPCPSVLCEVCFISNDAELERLKTKSFQENAAQAIYNGIDKILKAM